MKDTPQSRYYLNNRDEINAKKRQARRDKGELKNHEPRPCKICGKMFVPKRLGSGRGQLCPEPEKSDTVAHRVWRDCVNERQRLNCLGRLGKGED